MEIIIIIIIIVYFLAFLMLNWDFKGFVRAGISSMPNVFIMDLLGNLIILISALFMTIEYEESIHRICCQFVALIKNWNVKHTNYFSIWIGPWCNVMSLTCSLLDFEFFRYSNIEIRLTMIIIWCLDSSLTFAENSLLIANCVNWMNEMCMIMKWINFILKSLKWKCFRYFISKYFMNVCIHCMD